MIPSSHFPRDNILPVDRHLIRSSSVLKPANTAVSEVVRDLESFFLSFLLHSIHQYNAQEPWADSNNSAQDIFRSFWIDAYADAIAPHTNIIKAPVQAYLHKHEETSNKAHDLPNKPHKIDVSI